MWKFLFSCHVLTMTSFCYNFIKMIFGCGWIPINPLATPLALWQHSKHIFENGKFFPPAQQRTLRSTNTPCCPPQATERNLNAFPGNCFRFNLCHKSIVVHFSNLICIRIFDGQYTESVNRLALSRNKGFGCR